MGDWLIDEFSRRQIVAPDAPQVEKLLKKSTRDDELKPPMRHPLRFHLFSSRPRLDPASVNPGRGRSGDQK
jgi:hypothetical protein